MSNLPRALAFFSTIPLLFSSGFISPTEAFASPCVLNQQHYATVSIGRDVTATTHYAAPKHSPLEDEPWQKDDSYWDALQAASKDPETFEKFIEESMANRGKKPSDVVWSSSSLMNGANGNADDTAPKKKKYVPIEEWDAQRQNGEGMSKEERIQWECQRSGNQFKQNEILRQNLKSF